MADSRRKPAHDLESRRRTGDVLVAEKVDFSSLLLSQPVLEGLTAAGFERPSPIQLKAIPLGRCGLDLIVQAKSGTGKTCVFATIALDSLILENPATQILVLAPTREIAVQIHSVISAIGIKMDGLECHVFIGGMPLNQDKVRLKKCHIAVGSPGRIKQLIEIGYLNTASIRLFVLDEADKLLEQGSFQEQINWIYSSLPVNKQMLALSATYPESLAQHLTQYMRDPAFVRLNPSDPGLLGLKQYYKVVNSYPLPHKIFEEKVQNLMELFSKIPFNQALVFSNLHSRAQHLADILASKGLPAVCISGSMNQNQRLEAMAKLKQFHCRVLITTDLTSRGIDAERVNLVINLDVPQDWETYMHRIGRAGRFGTYGLAVTYCCRGEEENEMMTIAQKCNLQLSCLPDPIPPGLMEDFSEWDVEVTTVKSGNSVPSNVSVPKTAEICAALSGKTVVEQRRKNVPTTKKETVVSSMNKTSQQKHLKKVKREQPKKKEVNKEAEMNSGVLQQKDKAGVHPKDSITPGVQKPDTSKDPKTQHDFLPKIPSLPSFKNQMPLRYPVSFAELVEDYNLFIKEGIEKHVEFTREYTDSKSVLNQKPKEVDDPVVLKSEQNQNIASDQYSDSDSESDSSYFSSRSSSSRGSIKSSSEVRNSTMDDKDEKEQIVDSSNLPKTCSVSSKGIPPLSQTCSQNLFVAESSAEPCAEIPASCSSQKQGKKDNAQNQKSLNNSLSKKKLLKQNKKKSKGSFSGWDNSRPEEGDISPVHQKEHDLYTHKHQNTYPPLTEETNSDYWKAYYCAWQNYYAAMSSPYYRSCQGSPHWMTAYQMNSVYLNELLKK